ncbi:alpha/beta fold hydrolase [Xinfangfangia pollutisoli]|uniref:alpha/beta fold hydrolase n=1 Tax=Xinfangfangia pollutisoli TaxID=2865960 RepID=UPI001CD19B3F|nr:alpha/beta hydrolase [Xinfangfangia pollutisoli]
MQAHFTAEDGTRLAYRDEGEGLPLLALAGLTRGGRDFDDLAPHLPPGTRLIRLDSRGRGGSARADWHSYTVLQEMRDALALLDHLGLDRVAVIGTSRGGLLGLAMAAFARPRLCGLCLVDVGPVLERAGLSWIGAYIGVPPSFATLEEAAERLAASPGFAQVPASRWAEEAARRYVPRPGGGLDLPYDPALREAYLDAMAAPPVDLWPLFEGCVGLPLALIRGANSYVLSRATAEEMARRRPEMIFASVPDRGHVPFLDEPESVAAITEWLGQVRAFCS